MQAKERILHANNYMLLSHESGKTKWQVKSILVTEYSLMAFDNYDNLFSSSDSKPPKTCPEPPKPTKTHH